MATMLAIDFGSTFTKATAIDITNRQIIGHSKAFTTIETDVTIGLENALNSLFKTCGTIEFDYKMASSSAAGGLKMVSVGLVPDLTSKASKLAAASAGAKVLKTFSYELSKQEIAEIETIKPDIILLSGGIDGGNKEVIVANAKMLANSKGDYSVIVAGNKSVAEDVCDILTMGGKNVIICENVMPEFNKLNIMLAKAAIRDLFIKNIIEAKGLNKAQLMMTHEIIPTPLAVFDAAELLSRGTAQTKGLGEIMAYDVGGATTDVYSMAEGAPIKANVVLKGLQEPFAKRTVEGDIGMRYSLSSLISEVGAANLANLANVTEQDVLNWQDICTKNPETVATVGTSEAKIDEAFAKAAINVSANRHCGFFETAYTPFGEMFLQSGKDLSNVLHIIGSGGSVINAQNPKEILTNALFSMESMNTLKPRQSTFLLDRKNIFAAMGLLAKIDEEAALEIMKKEFVKI